MMKDIEDKLIRKERSWLGFVISGFLAGAAFWASELFVPLSYVICPIGMYWCYESIRNAVTYDITEWKNANVWIWLGGIFGGLGSFTVYMIIRHRKLKLNNNKDSVDDTQGGDK